MAVRRDGSDFLDVQARSEKAAKDVADKRFSFYVGAGTLAGAVIAVLANAAIGQWFERVDVNESAIARIESELHREIDKRVEHEKEWLQLNERIRGRLGYHRNLLRFEHARLDKFTLILVNLGHELNSWVAKFGRKLPRFSARLLCLTTWQWSQPLGLKWTKCMDHGR